MFAVGGKNGLDLKDPSRDYEMGELWCDLLH